MPNPDPKQAFPVHQILLAKNGIFIHENAATERLAAAKVYEFAYIFNPLAVQGGTGSPGNALAVILSASLTAEAALSLQLRASWTTPKHSMHA